MRVSYYSDTDTLYIELKEEVPGTGTHECMDDFVIDTNADGKPVGIEIEHASETVDLSHLKTEGLSSMRITYEVPSQSHGALSGGYITREPSTPSSHVRVSGNGESARIVSQAIHDQAALLFG